MSSRLGAPHSPLPLRVAALLPFALCSVAFSQGTDTATFDYAEGYSSAAPDQPVELRYRAFTIHSQPCEGLAVPARLTGPVVTVTLKVGEHFQLANIVLRAYDSRGAFLPRQPIRASLSFPRDVLRYDTDQHRNFELTALGEGRGSGHFTALCSEGTVQIKIDLVVVGSAAK